MRRPVRPAAALLLALLSLTFTGCESGKEFTPEEFKKVTQGMEETQVLQILGKPYDTFDIEGERMLWWKVKDQYYHVNFEKGKVDTAEGPSAKEEYELFKGLLEMARQFKK